MKVGGRKGCNGQQILISYFCRDLGKSCASTGTEVFQHGTFKPTPCVTALSTAMLEAQAQYDARVCRLEELERDRDRRHTERLREVEAKQFEARQQLLREMDQLRMREQVWCLILSFDLVGGKGGRDSQGFPRLFVFALFSSREGNAKVRSVAQCSSAMGRLSYIVMRRHRDVLNSTHTDLRRPVDRTTHL